MTANELGALSAGPGGAGRNIHFLGMDWAAAEQVLGAGSVIYGVSAFDTEAEECPALELDWDRDS